MINPNATSKELDLLLKTDDENLIKAIASHPNAAIKTLSNLFCRYPAEVLNNPALDLILLSEPDFLEKRCEFCKVRNRSARLPDFFLKWACDCGSISARVLIAENQHLPLKFIQKLAQDKNNIVRAYIATSICIDDNLLGYHNGQKINNRAVDIYPHEITKIIGQLAQDSNSEVRRAVALGLNTPSYILDKLSFDSNVKVRYSVAINPKTSPEILIRLSEDKNLKVIQAITTNTNIPLKVAEEFAINKNSRFRIHFAKNPKTNKLILKELAFDKDIRVRQAVFKNPNTLPEIIEQLKQEGFTY